MNTKKQYSVCALILAKGESKRLAEKNIFPLNGMPLICWSLEAAKKSKYISETFISTESEKVKNAVKGYDTKIIQRPHELTIEKNESAPRHDFLWRWSKQEVLDHAIQYIDYDIICLLQANSPQLETSKIDEAIEKVLLSNDPVFECISMNKNTLRTDGAIRVFKKECLQNKGLGMYLSCVLTDYIDVHTIEDIHELERILCTK
jgi:CMP-N,N'-diacetyllegionaminic acid synthase